MIWGFIKSALGFNSSIAETSSSISPFAVYGSLFMFIFMMTILIKAGLGAFKDTQAEQMNPVEDFQNLMQQKQKQQQQRQRAIEKANFKTDRIKK